MPSGVSLHWGGLDRVFFRAVHALSERQSLMDGVGEMLRSSTVQRFEDEKSPEGVPWTPSKRALGTEDRISPMRRDRKGRLLKGSGKKIKGREPGKTLTDTADLRRSIEYVATTNAVMLGSDKKYARIHQLGGKAGRGRTLNIEARPYVGVNADDKAEIQKALADFIADAFRGGS